MTRYLVALDVGTTRVKAAAWERSGSLAARAEAVSAPLAHHSGHAEQDVASLDAAVARALRDLSKEAPASSWEALALTTQRGTFLVEDENGEALSPVFSWLDRREGGDRWEWLKAHEPEIARRAGRVGSLFSRLTEKLTGRAVDTEQTLSPEWPRLRSLGAPRGPEVLSLGTALSVADTRVAKELGLRPGMPVVLSGGDKNCELVGSGVVAPGAGALSFGTALSLGTLVVENEASSEAFVTPSQIAGLSQMEIGVPFGGALWDWMAGAFGGVFPLPDVPGDGPLLFYPYLAGSLADPLARGKIVGLTPDVTPGDLFAAGVEGLLLELMKLREMFPVLASLSPVTLCGAGARTERLASWAADALRTKVGVGSADLAGPAGAVMTAACALGVTKDWEEAARRFVPPMTRWELPREEAFRHWQQRLEAYKAFAS